MDRFEQFLLTVTGIDHAPLAYLLQDTPTAPITNDTLLPGKCYLFAHGSLSAELVARKSHLSPCVEIDKVTLYNYIYPALEGGLLESACQPHEKTKDGMKVIKTIYTQHGGHQKWEKAHDLQIACLSTPWTSGRNATILSRIILLSG